MELIQIIEKITGKKAKINFRETMLGDISLTYADITKTNTKLDFKAKIKLYEGMNQVYNWYKTLD